MSSVVRSPLKHIAIGLGVAVVVVMLLLIGPRQAAASVTLNYFRAQWVVDAETAVITWQTATELDTVGFIVQRSTAPDTGFVDITEIIPAVGDQLTGWTYDPVADDPTQLTMGVTYWYRLVVINTSGPYDAYPPVAVMAGGWRPIYLPVMRR